MFDSSAAAYALVLGMVAAFNPCGFALLPAYITVLVTGSAHEGVTRTMAVRRALMFGLAMTVGFMAIFTAFGLLFGAVSLGLQGSILPYVSYITAVLGVLLIWLGIVLVRGGSLKGPGLRMDSRAPSTTFWSQTLYGASFAVASLTCTIGLFLVIVTQALSATNPVGAVTPFLVYGVGMGTSIVLVSLLAALAGSGVAASLRSKTPVLMRVGGGLMVAAGAYVLVFGVAEILPRFGITALDPVLFTTIEWQGRIVQSISSWGTPVLLALVGVAVIAIVWALVRSRHQVTTVESVSVPSSSTPRLDDAPVTVASDDVLDAMKAATKKPRG